MEAKHPSGATPVAPADDRSWAARTEALKREQPAQLALVFAMLAFQAMLAGWVVVLIPPGGNVRFDPLFWLLALPFLVWLWGAQSFAAWVVRTVWLLLLLLPCLALLAMIVAPGMREAALLETGRASLDTDLAMRIILGLTTVLAGAGLVALRRSSLPGGTRPASYVVPGTPVPGAHTLSEDARSVLMLGSLPLSGAVINGIFFAIVATMEPLWPGSPVWVPALVGILVLTSGILVFRGGFRLARCRAGAAADLRRGWLLGMGCALAALLGLWAWPTLMAAKLGFSCFMVPVAVAAVWCGRAALRALPGIVGRG